MLCTTHRWQGTCTIRCNESIYTNGSAVLYHRSQEHYAGIFHPNPLSTIVQTLTVHGIGLSQSLSRRELRLTMSSSCLLAPARGRRIWNMTLQSFHSIVGRLRRDDVTGIIHQVSYRGLCCELDLGTLRRSTPLRPLYSWATTDGLSLVLCGYVGFQCTPSSVPFYPRCLRAKRAVFAPKLSASTLKT